MFRIAKIFTHSQALLSKAHRKKIVSFLHWELRVRVCVRGARNRHFFSNRVLAMHHVCAIGATLKTRFQGHQRKSTSSHECLELVFRSLLRIPALRADRMVVIFRWDFEPLYTVLAYSFTLFYSGSHFSSHTACVCFVHLPQFTFIYIHVSQIHSRSLQFFLCHAVNFIYCTTKRTTTTAMVMAVAAAAATLRMYGVIENTFLLFFR